MLVLGGDEQGDTRVDILRVPSRQYNAAGCRYITCSLKPPLAAGMLTDPS